LHVISWWWCHTEALDIFCFVGKVIMLGEAEELIGPMNLLLVLALLPLQYTYPSLKPLALYSNVARPGKPGKSPLECGSNEVCLERT
jgi:hypothetical protein